MISHPGNPRSKSLEANRRTKTVKQESPKNQPAPVIGKRQNVSLEHKTFAFILGLGVFGATLGGISTEIDIRSCTQQADCSLLNLSQRRLQGIQNGGFAGMAAALIACWPAVKKSLKSY